MNNMDYETLRNSMTVQDAARVLEETNCYGTMDIAKSVILRALEQEPCEKCCNGNQEEKAKLCQKSYIAGMEQNCENEERYMTTEAKIYGQPSEDWNAVLDELNRIGRNAFKDDTDYDNLFDFISNLPNVKSQSRWIPVSESMPIIGQEVLVCDLDGDMYIAYLHTDGGWGFDYCGNKIKNVVAWMPLPAPYKAESEE